MQYIKKSCRNCFVFRFDAKHSDILRGSSHVRCYLLLIVFGLVEVILTKYINKKEQNKLIKKDKPFTFCLWGQFLKLLWLHCYRILQKNAFVCSVYNYLLYITCKQSAKKCQNSKLKFLFFCRKLCFSRVCPWQKYGKFSFAIFSKYQKTWFQKIVSKCSVYLTCNTSDVGFYMIFPLWLQDTWFELAWTLYRISLSQEWQPILEEEYKVQNQLLLG